MKLRIATMALVLASVIGCGKPNITQDCTMNGRGEGECSFTNTGTGAGSRCGKVKVVRYDNDREATSPIFCSGEVAKTSTTKVEFKIPAVNDLCEADVPWNEVCSFTFETEDPKRPGAVGKQPADDHQETQRLVGEAQRLVDEANAIVQEREAQQKRIAAATFSTSRLPGIDGLCLGKGKPAFGYTVQGSTYADNVLVGQAAQCEPFGQGENNITNAFCCQASNLPTVLQVSASITPSAPSQ